MEEEVQDWACAPSPLAVTALPLWDEAVEDTLPSRQNRQLVSECFIGLRAALPHEHTPEAEAGKIPLTEDIPAGGQEPTHIILEDEIVELHAGMEEL